MMIINKRTRTLLLLVVQRRGIYNVSFVSFHYFIYEEIYQIHHHLPEIDLTHTTLIWIAKIHLSSCDVPMPPILNSITCMLRLAIYVSINYCCVCYYIFFISTW